MRKKSILFLLLVFVLILTNVSGAWAKPNPPKPDHTSASDAPAPAAGLVDVDPARVIPGEYIVVFKPGTPGKSQASSMQKDVRGKGGKVHYQYKAVFDGFAANLPDQALQGLLHNPNVSFIEPDQVLQLDGSQANPPWGLDRIDQASLPLNKVYNYSYTGAGVNVYVIDTGIRYTHTQFGGRAHYAYDTVGDGRNGVDCNGHGTHVAATIGGSTYGVAKSVNLYGVRVLNCSGSGANSGVIAGIDWVTQHRVFPAVANLSLGGGASSALDTAVANSIASGVTYAIAAGNSNANACNSSPSRVASALTVGATDSADNRAYYSNFGSCLDVFAPGSSILSAWYTSDTATNTISGTSMATPHVAGAAALLLQAYPSSSPAQVANAIVNYSAGGKVINAGSGSPNRLLQSLFNTTPPPPPPTPCTNCTKYTGSLSGNGDYDYQPNGTYYYSSASGLHKGWLQGPSGADFDLYLYKWGGSSWTQVAKATGTTSTESISYSGTAGYYLWEVLSYSGSGSYSFWLAHP